MVFWDSSRILRIPFIPVNPWFSSCLVSLVSDFRPVPPTEGLVSLYSCIPMKTCVWFFWETLVFFVSLYPHEKMVLVFLGDFCPENQTEGLVSLCPGLLATCLCYCCKMIGFSSVSWYLYTRQNCFCKISKKRVEMIRLPKSVRSSGGVRPRCPVPLQSFIVLIDTKALQLYPFLHPRRG